MKILCETTGDFMLADLANGQSIVSTRPCVVTKTGFTDQRSMIGQIRKLADLTDEATDEEFAKYVQDSEDMELAVESFVAAFGVEKPTEKKVSKRKSKGAEAPTGGEGEGQPQE